jgi:hypothetical protein
VSEHPFNPTPRPRHPDDDDPIFDPFPDAEEQQRAPIAVYGPDGREYIHPADLPDHQTRPTPEGKAGYRIGPMVFVPELLSRKGDPWAHRKAEPRFFALFWSLYLMTAALLTIFAVRSVGMPSRVQFTFGCQAMIFLSMIGACVLFPMTRLSQLRPRKPFRALTVDLLIIVLPIAAVVVPMPMLTNWPLPIAAALILLVVSWATLTTAPVYWALRDPDQIPATRGLAMLAILIAVGLGPALTVIAGWLGMVPPAGPTTAGGGGGVGGLGAGYFAYASPFTAAPAITDAPPNMRASLTAAEWLLIAAPIMLAPAAFVLAAIWSPWQHAHQQEVPRTPRQSD